MKRKTVSGIVLTVFLVNMLAMAFRANPVKAQEPYIKVYVDQPLGYIPGAPPGNNVTVDIIIEVSGIADHEGIMAWGLDVQVDPDILEPKGATGATSGYFLWEYAQDFGRSVDFHVSSIDTTTGFISVGEILHPPFPPLGGPGEGYSGLKLVTLEFTSKSETASSLIVIIDFSCVAAIPSHEITVDTVDGFYASATVVISVFASPSTPNYDEETTINATIIDDVAVDQALLSYTHDLTWHNVSMDRFDDVFSATIPPQAYGSLVQYMIYANDTDGNWGLSKIYAYTIIDTVPPEIHSVQCTSLLNIHANVTEPTSASGVDKLILHLRVDNGDWWNTTLTYDSTMGLWTRILYGYNQLAGKTIEYFIEAYDKAGNKNTSAVLSHSVDERTIADLNRDSKVDRVDMLILVRCLGRGAPLIGFAGLLIGSVVYVKRRKKKQQD